MMDVMYFGYTWDSESRKYQEDFIKEVKEAFPNVKLKDAYNEIKGYRQEVWLEDNQEDDYMAFLIGNGWHNLSLTLQVAMMTNESKDDVMKWIDLAKKQFSENLKQNTEEDGVER